MNKHQTPLSITEERTILICTGKDCLAYLNRLISCDIKKIKKNIGIWGCLLTPQGKLSYDFLISLNEKSNILIDCPTNQYNALLQLLNKYKLRDDVKIEKTNLLTLIFFNEEHIKKYEISNNYFIDPRNPRLGWRAYIDKENLEIAYNFSTETNNWHTLRIILGIFDSYCDLLNNKSYPIEMGFDAYNAISWDKGCYIGQEVTARIKHRSLLKSHLIPIQATLAINWQLGDKVYENSMTANDTPIEIGNIIAISGNNAFANIKLKYYFNLNSSIICRNQIVNCLPLPIKIKDYLENHNSKVRK